MKEKNSLRQPPSSASAAPTAGLAPSSREKAQAVCDSHPQASLPLRDQRSTQKALAVHAVVSLCHFSAPSEADAFSAREGAASLRSRRDPFASFEENKRPEEAAQKAPSASAETRFPQSDSAERELRAQPLRREDLEASFPGPREEGLHRRRAGEEAAATSGPSPHFSFADSLASQLKLLSRQRAHLEEMRSQLEELHLQLATLQADCLRAGEGGGQSLHRRSFADRESAAFSEARERKTDFAEGEAEGRSWCSSLDPRDYK